MDIEERIEQQSIQNILKDPKKYRKMMLIIQQTLYDLGYHQSAKMLQSQSGISFYSKQLKALKNYLDTNDFNRAINIIDDLLEQAQSNSLNGTACIKQSTLKEAQDMVYETFCIHKIHNHDFDEAMNIMNLHIHNQEKKQKLCQALVFGNISFLQKDLQKKKTDIFRFCLQQYQQIGDKQIQKVIECYTQFKGQSNKQLKNLRFPSSRFPPMKILSKQSQNIIKAPVTHLKINQFHKLLLVMTQNKQTQSILLFRIHMKNLSYHKQISEYGSTPLKQKYPIFLFVKQKKLDLLFNNKKQSIESIAWNNSRQVAILAVSSFSIIQLYNNELQLIKRIESQNRIQKNLHLLFNPISDFLYSGGYFEYMNVYNKTGEYIFSIHPFPKVRKFLFYKRYIISISLVSNKVYKHSVDEQNLIMQKQLDENCLPMDICVANKFGVSSLLYIYVLNVDSLQIICKTNSPINPNKVTVEINFYGEYLISLCRNFHAYEIIRQNNETNINKIRQWKGEGTFTVCQSQGLFLNGANQLIVFQQGDIDERMDQEQQFQQISLIEFNVQDQNLQSNQDQNQDDDYSEQSDLDHMSDENDDSDEDEIIPI